MLTFSLAISCMKISHKINEFNSVFLYREEMEYIKIPRNIEDAKNLGKVLSRYKEDHYFEVLGAYFSVYILYPLENSIYVTCRPLDQIHTVIKQGFS